MWKVKRAKRNGNQISRKWEFVFVSVQFKINWKRNSPKLIFHVCIFFFKIILFFIFLFNLKMFILISIFHIQQYMHRFLIYIQNSRIEEEKRKRKRRKQTQERHYHHHHQNQCTISQSESTILWKRFHLNLIVELNFYWFIQIASVISFNLKLRCWIFLNEEMIWFQWNDWF